MDAASAALSSTATDGVIDLPARLGGGYPGPMSSPSRPIPCHEAGRPTRVPWDDGNVIALGQQSQPRWAVMAVGDPRRPAIGRAVFATLVAAAVFTAVTDPTKQFKAIYDHAPWENDPFDTVYSFTQFFVPLVAVFCLVRVTLCRKSEPLPVGRVLDLLRGCRVAVGTMAIALLTDWVSVAIGANRQQWNGTTGVLVGVLALTTAVTAVAILGLLRVPSPRRAEPAGNAQTMDWLADMVTVAQRESHWLGPLRRPAVGVLNWIDVRLLSLVRRHPLLAAALASVAFAAAVGGAQAFREGYSSKVFLLFFVVLGCGMFSFLAVAGWYVGFVRSVTPLRGVRRRVLDAMVMACSCTVIALAFRSSLWWIVGTRDALAGLPQLASLLAVVALAAFLLVFSVESLVRSHAEGAH